MLNKLICDIGFLRLFCMPVSQRVETSNAKKSVDTNRKIAYVGRWYSYSQTMISEVVPKGKEFLFFALFSIIGKTSSFIGPFVSSAIIDRSGNDNMPFAFLLALGVASSILLILVDVGKSRRECKDYLEKDN